MLQAAAQQSNDDSPAVNSKMLRPQMLARQPLVMATNPAFEQERSASDELLDAVEADGKSQRNYDRSPERPGAALYHCPRFA